MEQRDINNESITKTIQKKETPCSPSFEPFYQQTLDVNLNSEATSVKKSSKAGH